MQGVTDLSAWIGREQVRREIIDQKHCRLMAVTLDRDAPGEGEALPLPWHWGWFNDAKPAGDLGRDGHPKKGDFLPPVPLPRRMWGGGEIESRLPVIIGKEIVRRSVIENVVEKSGRSGALCIVTVRHELSGSEGLCVVEKQDLIYREDPKNDAATPIPLSPPQDAEIRIDFKPDPVLMFRYSALTFNGHRIHYDVDYARNVEGYPGLVFHAPLTAILLYQVAQDIAACAPTSFKYRATAPLFCNEQMSFCGKKDEGKVIVWAEAPDGAQAMIAEAVL